MSRIETVDIASPAFKANPYPYYARLRAEAPVHRVPLAGKQSAWLVTRHDDVTAMLKDDRFVKNRWSVVSSEQAARQPWVPKFVRPLERNMLDLDPPDHTRLRGLVHKAFTPRLIEDLRGRIQELTDELIDAVEPRGRMDVIRDYAQPLPTTIIAEMLGVPVKDRHRFQRWSNTLVSKINTTWELFKAIPALWAFMSYVRKLIQSRRESPG